MNLKVDPSQTVSNLIAWHQNQKFKRNKIKIQFLIMTIIIAAGEPGQSRVILTPEPSKKIAY
jgi:hypothetical protein